MIFQKENYKKTIAPFRLVSNIIIAFVLHHILIWHQSFWSITGGANNKEGAFYNDVFALANIQPGASVHTMNIKKIMPHFMN